MHSQQTLLARRSHSQRRVFHVGQSRECLLEIFTREPAMLALVKDN
jgi:hypothetical protein